MDPLTALGVVGNVIQIIDFSAKVISRSAEIYGSGGLVGNSELKRVTVDLLSFSQNLEKSLGTEPNASPSDAAEQALGKDCQRVASELLFALEKIKSKNKPGKWDSFRQALLTIWKKDQIEELEKRLDRIRQQLLLRLVSSLRDTVQTISRHGVADGHHQATIVEQEEKELGRALLKHASIERWRSSLIHMLSDHGHQSNDPFNSTSDLTLERMEALEERLLATLSFSELSEREERVSNALRNTFEWIYRDPEPGVDSWASFATWLERGDGIYWIGGKAGSGKSTLMKFLQRDWRTTKFLEVWSKGLPLTTSGFFFWNSGTEIQMSQEGLLRSLLYNVVKKSMHFIPCLFPERWEIMSLGQDPPSWTVTECIRSLRRLTTPHFARHRIFFLIDGLDEFSGDQKELISLLKELEQARHIKICVASRPWPVFQDAFNKSPSLALQDLTRRDIEFYVNTNFDNHAGFNELKAYEPKLASDLCDEIVRKCSGVFLWVRLVVRSLLEGISNGDRISDLYQRLNGLPEELEDLFWKIMRSFDSFYKVHASQLFQICRAAKSITITRLSFADEENDRFWRDVKLNPLSDNEISMRIRAMKRRLDSRTKGLLEVGEISAAKIENNRSLLQYSASSSCQRSSMVQYLHRTVKDFVQKSEVWREILAMTMVPFDPYMFLCKGYLLEAKTTQLSLTFPKDLWRVITRALGYASKATTDSHASLIPLLDELNRVTTLHSNQLAHGSKKDFPTAISGHAILLPAALQLDLYFWVEELLNRGHPIIREKSEKPYILEALEFEETKSGLGWLDPESISSVPTFESLRLLLERGADPHEKHHGRKVWHHIQDLLMEKTSSDVANEWLALVGIFIPFGICLINSEDMDSTKSMSPDEMTKIKEFLRKHPGSSRTPKRKGRRGNVQKAPEKISESESRKMAAKARKKSHFQNSGATTEELERMQRDLFVGAAERYEAERIERILSRTSR